MPRNRSGYNPSAAYGHTIAKAVAPRVPEYRAERPSTPYVGPVTPAEWVDAFADMAADQPDEWAELTGQRFTR